MSDSFDVIVVGARCAGSPLATTLAARGLQVCVVDRASFPSEVPSTHMIHPSGVALLGNLGLHDKLLGTGAPPLERGGFCIDNVRLELDPEIARRFEAPWLCIRRSILDALLLDRAREAGAQVRTQTAVTAVLREDGVVRGVQTSSGTLRAPLVVGADGPRSAIARFVGAREYHVTAPGRLFLWAYFEGVSASAARAELGRVRDISYLAMPTDGGLFMAGIAVSMAARDLCMADVEGAFRRGISQVERLQDILAPAIRLGPIRTMTRWRGYFREAAGPGWVLVGDAGHFKDPTPAQGITDALRQADRLAEVIGAGTNQSDLNVRLKQWWRWRDDDAWDMYWFAHDMGTDGEMPGIVTEVIRGLSGESDGTEKFLRMLNHEIGPSNLFSMRRGLRTLIRSSVVRPSAMPGLIAETGRLVGQDSDRRRLRRHPQHVTADAEVHGKLLDA